MKNSTKQNQFERFLDNLSEDEFGIVCMVYEDPYFIDFDEVLAWGVKENPPGFKKDIPIVKKLANFERTHKVKLFELLDIPGMMYEGQVIPMCESVLLPVETAENGESIDVHLGSREQLCLHIRDMHYAGSWKRMKSDTPCEHCLATINNLIKYERKHRVNLGVLMREWVPLEPEGKKKNKIT